MKSTTVLFGLLLFYAAVVIGLFLLWAPIEGDTWTPTDTSEKCFIRTYDDTRTLYCVMGLKEGS